MYKGTKPLTLPPILRDKCWGIQPVSGVAHLESSRHRSQECRKKGEDFSVKHASHFSGGILEMDECRSNSTELAGDLLKAESEIGEARSLEGGLSPRKQATPSKSHEKLSKPI